MFRQALVIPIQVNLVLTPALVHHKRGTLWARAKLSLILSKEASSPCFLVSVRGIPLSAAWRLVGEPTRFDPARRPLLL